MTKRIGLMSLALVVLWGVPNEAFAYPQYIAHGYASCGSCHYSPDGGGLLNAYGVAVTQALLPDEVDVGFLFGTPGLTLGVPHRLVT